MDKETPYSLYVPESISKNYSVSESHIAKLGLLRFEMSSEFYTEFHKTHNIPPRLLGEYVDEVYSLLKSSPHITDISPSREEYSKGDHGEPFGVLVWPDERTLSLGTFLSLRIVLPQQKLETMRISTWSWNPEEFLIYFDGALFVAYTPIKSLPIHTDIGQIARDLLTEAMRPARIFHQVFGVSPTPIDPDFYSLRVTSTKEAYDGSRHLPLIRRARKDLVIITSTDSPKDIVIKPLLRDTRNGLFCFYRQRIAQRKLTVSIRRMLQLNERLNKLVADFFRLSIIRRMFSGKSRTIRKLISEMHMSLQNISSFELQIETLRQQTWRTIERSTFLKELRPYFREHMERDTPFDRDVELTTMDFAVRETSNFSMVQATVIAALSGALLGSALTMLVQYIASKLYH